VDLEQVPVSYKDIKLNKKNVSGEFFF